MGIASRRACDDIIAAGRVRVGGRVVREPGERVRPGLDAVTLDGTPVDRPRKPLVLLLHKPAGVVSTAYDPQGRPTVVDLCRPYNRTFRLFPVGRLDVNTTGALLVTNDGMLCYRLTHPSFEVPRTYVVRVRGAVTVRALERMRRMAGAADSRPVGVEVVKEVGKITVVNVTLIEGRNRQVRRMCEAVGLRVVKLKRVSFGPVSVRGLPLGAVRPLRARELERLERITSAGREDSNGHRKAGKTGNS